MKALITIFFFLTVASIITAQEFAPPDDLKPGMKGYGLTVVKGWDPEKFQVEIIDVMKNVQPGSDPILVKMAGLSLEESGVVAGMSGSPVYIDGRLVGAVSYGDLYPKEPICMLTPIGDMVAEKNYEFAIPMETGSPKTYDKNISTPLYTSGFSGDVNDYLQNYFDSNSRAPLKVIGGGGEVTDTTSGGLKPGDGVAVNLIDGDFVAAGIGTVTYVSNNDVFIFGHTMGLAGNIRLPVSKAYIYTVFPSYYHSFKIGTSSVPIGSTIVDGKNAVYCRLGEKASMVPVTVKIESGGSNYINHFRVANSLQYFPSLAAAAITASYQNRAGNYDEQRLKMNISMDLVYNGSEYSVSNEFEYGFYPVNFNLSEFLNDLGSYFTVFYNRTIGNVLIKGVNIKIKVDKGIKYYIFENIKCDRDFYYPGDRIELTALFRDFQGSFVTKHLSLPLPDNIKPGKYWVSAGSEVSFKAELTRLFPRYFEIDDFSTLLEIANMSQKATVLTAGILEADPGINIRGFKMEKFPVRYLGYYPEPAEGVPYVYYPVLSTESQQLDSVLFGVERLQVNIRGIQRIPE